MSHTVDRFGNQRLIWAPARLDELCEMVANGLSFREAADRLGCSHKAADGAFRKVCDAYGWQAR